MNTLCIIQARLGSERFPGKVLEILGGKPLVHFLYDRLTCGNKVINIPDNDDKALFERNHRNVLSHKEYDEDDVLGRFWACINKEWAKANITHIVRLTADCPLLDPRVVNMVINTAASTSAEYVATRNDDHPTGYPDGMDVECFTVEALDAAYPFNDSLDDREHVTPWIRRNPKYNKIYLTHEPDLSHYKWSVDTPEDLEHVRRMYALLPPDFTMYDIVRAEEELKK